MEIFQNNIYQKCLVILNDDDYYWTNTDDCINVELPNDPFITKIFHIGQQFESQRKVMDYDCCFGIQITSNITVRSKKHYFRLIREYLRHFTMDEISVLDSLALYFVNAILDMKYYHKNTLVCGDIDKFNHWIDLFCPSNLIRNISLMRSDFGKHGVVYTEIGRIESNEP